MDGWVGHIQGSVINISAKPDINPTDSRSNAAGLLPAFKIKNSDGWKLSGGYMDNRYREAFYIENCNDFVNSCDNLSSNLNDNLPAKHYRHCNHFCLHNFKVSK